jgi:hypothetical protein
MSLRKEIIRLAHSNPELREHLLPLVTTDKTAMRGMTHEFIAKKTVSVPTITKYGFEVFYFKQGENTVGTIQHHISNEYLIVKGDAHKDYMIIEKSAFEII